MDVAIIEPFLAIWNPLHLCSGDERRC